MASSSARQMLGSLPVLKMAIGGDIDMPEADGDYTQAETKRVFDLITSGQITAADASAFYGIDEAIINQNITNTQEYYQTLRNQEAAYLEDMETDPSKWDTATAYNAIVESGVSVQDALDAGVKQSTIDQIFSTDSSGVTVADIMATTAPSVYETNEAYKAQGAAAIKDSAQAYLTKVMADGVIDDAERLAMQKIATEEGVTFQDMVDAGIDPNILYTKATKPTCTPPAVYNEATGKCELKATPPVDCTLGGTRTGWVWDAGLGVCIKDTQVTCPTGYTLNTNTQLCEKKATTITCPQEYVKAGQVVASLGDCGGKKATTITCPQEYVKAGQVVASLADCGGKKTTTTITCPQDYVKAGQTAASLADCGGKKTTGCAIYQVKNAANQCVDKTCPTGQTLNKTTGNCDGEGNPCGVGYEYDTALMKCVKKAVTCAATEYYDPSSGNCITIPTCATGQEWDSVFKACVNKKVNTNCIDGMKWSQALGKCVSIFKEVDTNTGSGADSATGVVTYEDADLTATETYATGEDSLDTTFRESAPRTEVTEDVMGEEQLVGFDYGPAAKLLSSTGSGFSWTPPSVTGRKRALMGNAQLGRYTQGRAAQDLRQLTGGNQVDFNKYKGLLGKGSAGSYGGGLSRSQLYALMQQQQGQEAATAAAAIPSGDIAAYLAANPDIQASYEAQKGQLGGQTLNDFARTHYNTFGKKEMTAGTRNPFTLTGGYNTFTPQKTGGTNEGDDSGDYDTEWWEPGIESRYSMGPAGGARIFAKGGPVKKPEGFVDGGSASADLKLLDPVPTWLKTDPLFITETVEEEVNPDMVQRDIPPMEWDGVERTTDQDPPFVDRINNPQNYPVIENPDGSVSTHRMSAEVDEHGNWYVFPTIQMENGVLKVYENNQEAMKNALATGNYLQAPNKEEAIRYAEGAYKKGTPLADPRPPRVTDQESTESKTMLENLVAGAAQIPDSVANYFIRPDETGGPSLVSPRQVGSDLVSLGGAMKEGFQQDPIGLTLDMLPVTGEVRSGMDVEKFSNMANEARASGDDSAAGLYEQLVTLSAAGTLPLIGMGARVQRRAAISAVEEAIKKGALGEAAKLLNDAGESSYPLAKDWYGDQNYRETGGELVYMDPAEYLSSVRPLQMDDMTRANVDDLKRHIQEGGELDPLAIYPSGLEDGRHRAIAAQELGLGKVPVLRWSSESARMLDEVDAANAPRTDVDFSATVVSRMEEIATNPAVANDPVAMRFLQQIMDDPEAAIAQYEKIGETNGGNIINTDLVRELSPDYLADRTLAFNVHQPASALSELMFNRRVAETMGEEGTWIFTGGGPASGKTAGLSDEAAAAADLVMDGTLAKFAKNDALIERALESGKDIQIFYIDRDPLKALPLALMRAMQSGRPVPLEEFARMHRDARASIVRLHEKYKDNPMVDIKIVDNQGKMGEQFETTIDNLSEMDYNDTLTEGFRMLEEARLRPEKKGDINGGINEAIYQGTKGSYDPGAAQGQKSRVAQAVNEGSQGNGSRNSSQQTSVEGERAAALSITDQQRATWRENNKGNFRRQQTPELSEAAEKLGRGEISIADYAKEVQRLRPIEPLTSVPKISTFREIVSALNKDKVEKGIIGLDKEIADGTLVGARLDIPAYDAYDTWVVSVHSGTGSSGSSLGYGKVAVLDNVVFNSSPDAAYKIATGQKNKSTFARMNGSWRNVDPETAIRQAEEYLTDPDWVQVGMNPYRHSFFYDKATGQPLASADEVIQIGPLVLARNAKTRPLESPEHALNPKKRKEGEPEFFKKGGSIERVYNDRRYI